MMEKGKRGQCGTHSSLSLSRSGHFKDEAGNALPLVQLLEVLAFNWAEH